MPARVPVLVDQVVITAELRPEGVVIAGSDAPYRAIADFDGRYRLEGPSAPTTAVAAVAGNVVWIAIDDEVFECRVGAAASRGSRARDAQALAAPMPATVVNISVRVGQTVVAGDVLISLEAMKMELPMKAPHGGEVIAVHCRDGELVQPGIVLVEIAES